MDRRQFLALGALSSHAVALPAFGAPGGGPKRGLRRLADPVESPTGLSTGWSDLDALTGGLHRGDLLVLGGRPAMGKSTMALNIAAHAIVTDERNVAVFSMERPAEQVALSVVATLADVAFHELRTGQVDETAWSRVEAAIATVNDRGNLHVDDAPTLTPADLAARAGKIARDRELGLIVVDYLQLMTLSSPSPNRTVGIGEIARSLKALAERLNAPVLALAQLNRALERRPDRRPVVSDLTDHETLVEHADVIAFAYRHEVYEPEDASARGRAEILVRKQRGRPPGRVDLAFRPPARRFDDWRPSAT